MVVAPSDAGVNVAVYTVLEVAVKLLTLPPLTDTSSAVKLVVASEAVNVNDNVPSFVVVPSTTTSVPLVAVIVMVGLVPS